MVFFFCTQKPKNANSLKCVLWIMELVNGGMGNYKNLCLRQLEKAR